MPHTRYKKPKDLFEAAAAAEKNSKQPLADRMRPRTLDEFVGQEHILGPGRLLRRAIQADRLTSVIFSGPPGTGKTTLARIVANTTQSQFLAINAVLAGVKDIREAIESAAEARKLYGQGTLLFIDEVHRFNKAQQDALLPHVENGTLILIGATTENPYFEVNKALVSRSRIFQLQSLEERDVKKALENAIHDPERGYGKLKVEMEDGALEHIVRMASGDARSALNALELAVETTKPDDKGIVRITLAVAEESIQRKAVLYDKDGDAHYDTISAFIKSLRGSDPDAALYWLAKMVEAGEDSRFIFRRMIILAAEDVGLADPKALNVVMSAAAAFDYVGLPEGQFHLSEACLYLATAPKSNSTLAYFDALATVRKERIGEVPDALRDASRDADLGHGQGYMYPHAYRDHWVAQQYLPSSLKGKVFYEPGNLGHEASLREEILRRRESQIAAPDETEAQAHSAQPNAQSGQWLERAAGVGSDALRSLRDDLCEAAGLRRESLALDLGGHHGFLTWELLRRCIEGGVWSRCENENEKSELKALTEKVGPLNKPHFWIAPMNSLPESATKLTDKPSFDVVMALQPNIPSVDWMNALQQTIAPSARWVLAFRRESDSVSKEWLAEIPASLQGLLRDRVDSLPVAKENESDGEKWEKLLRGAGWHGQRFQKQYDDHRRLTPSQAREWILRASERPHHIFAAIKSALPEEWERLLNLASGYFSGASRNFPATFDILVVDPS